MTKPLTIRDSTYSDLKKLKDQHENLSYSDVIDMLLHIVFPEEYPAKIIEFNKETLLFLKESKQESDATSTKLELND